LKIIDLSLPIEEVPSEMIPLKIKREDHEASAKLFCDLFGCTEQDLPQGLGWATDYLELSTHNGTHLDAPWHYFPISEGRRAKTVDEVPLEWCFGNGIILDFSDKPDGYKIGIEDLELALEKIDYRLKEGDIVLIRTDAYKYWGEPEYFDKGCGLGRESTLWILDHGVKVVGIDAWTWDIPFKYMKKLFEETKDKSVLWAGHRAGIDREYCHIEKLANLDRVPEPYGFKFACFPIKIKGASAGWCRAVAILE
jgi:kynurenine formamidase